MSAVADLADLTGRGAGSVAAVADELIGPLSGSVVPQALPWQPGAGSVAGTDAVTRYPMASLTLLTDLTTQSVTVVPTLAVQNGPGTDLPAVTFTAWSQAGTSVPAYAPPTDGGAAAPFRLSLTAVTTNADGTSTPVSTADLTTLVRIDLVEGQLGRVVAVLVAEKARLRRTAREVAALRLLATARGNALDRTGADLTCPRFADELVWDPGRNSPGTQPLTPPGRMEPDADYRARLRILRSLRLPSRSWIETMMNGAGGWLSDVGIATAVEVDEAANDLHIAFRLVAPGLERGRAELLDGIRLVHLVWPAGSATGDGAHAGRLLPASVQQAQALARAALQRWQLPADQPVAPALARALHRLDERCTQLGARPWPRVTAGQQDGGGSRLELGLGAVLAPVQAAQLDEAVTAATASADPALVPRSRAEDPIGGWLLAACGLRTAELMSDGSVFVSAAPMGPLVVDVAPSPDAGVPLTLTAHLVSATDNDHDAPMAAVVAAMAARSLPAAADPQSLLTGMQPTSAVPALQVALAALGLPRVLVVADFIRQLGAVTTRQYAAFDLGPARTAAVGADPRALEPVLAAAAGAGASSVVPVVSAAGDLALLLGVVGLPLAGSNLAARQTVLYRWELRGLAGDPVQLQPRRGAGVQVIWPGDGISVIACVAHVRGRGNDPYEWSPAPPDGALLTLRQYEHLMNIVELVTPIGVRANTWYLRREHVDVDGSGTPVPLSPAAARTYRRYRSARASTGTRTERTTQP